MDIAIILHRRVHGGKRHISTDLKKETRRKEIGSDLLPRTMICISFLPSEPEGSRTFFFYLVGIPPRQVMHKNKLYELRIEELRFFSSQLAVISSARPPKKERMRK